MIKTVTQKVLCDYCGGYDGVFETKDKHMTTAINEIIDVSMTYNRNGKKDTRLMCMPCFIKVFDTVLGKPQKKEGINA